MKNLTVVFSDGRSEFYKDIRDLWMVPSEGCHFKWEGNTVSIPPFQVRTFTESRSESDD